MPLSLALAPSSVLSQEKSFLLPPLALETQLGELLPLARMWGSPKPLGIAEGSKGGC